MGQKVHPIGIRLGISADWNSTWYAGNEDYANYLNDDIKVREFLKKELAHASVSKIHIDRPAKAVVITVHSARPGIVIGKKVRMSTYPQSDCTNDGSEYQQR